LNNRNELADQLLKSQGWEGLEVISNDPGDKKFEQAMELAKQIHLTFTSDSGKYVLERFVNSFLTKPIVRPGEDAFAQGIREGRADVMRQILQQIEFAKNGDKK